MTTREQRVAEAVRLEVVAALKASGGAVNIADLNQRITAAVLAALAEPEEVPEGWEYRRIYYAATRSKGVTEWVTGSDPDFTEELLPEADPGYEDARCWIEARVPKPMPSAPAVVPGKVVQG